MGKKIQVGPDRDQVRIGAITVWVKKIDPKGKSVEVMVEKDSKCPESYILHPGDKMRVTHEIDIKWRDKDCITIEDSLGWGEI